MKIIKLIIIILVIAIIAVGGYYVYTNYFAKNQTGVKSSQESAAVKSPKATYIEFINKIQQVATLEEAMTLSMDYGYFATPAEKEKAVADATSQVQQLTEAQKIAQLGFIKSLMVLPPAENITETISGNSATVESVGSDGSKSTAKMIKDGGVWKLTQ